jgi:hypothetical protein
MEGSGECKMERAVRVRPVCMCEVTAVVRRTGGTGVVRTVLLRASVVSAVNKNVLLKKKRTHEKKTITEK